MTTWLITGGTGTFGQAFARLLLDTEDPQAVRILSRDEYKQGVMAERFKDDRLRFLIGDVRDLDRLRRAFAGVDIVVHAAALKQVVASEYNPIEFVKTNVMGSVNVIDAAIDAGVSKVMAISSDKAVAPVNLYGFTKGTMERLMLAASAYAGASGIRFACVRYGNVVGSRGSVVNLWREQAAIGRLTITDKRMTRFFITIAQATRFVLASIKKMEDGHIYIPDMPSVRMVDVARAIAPGAVLVETGFRIGEKLHEQVDARTFSDTNKRFLSVEEIAACVSSASFSHA